MMEQSVRNQTTMSKTTNRNRTAGGIEAPSIANASATSTASASALANASTAASASAASASSSSSSSVSSATCSATIVQAKQRPPPLKTATTTVTTTLVSSSEGGQPIPPSAHATGAAGGGSGGGANASGSYRGATTLTTPSTPRIELSRASSSSHHEEDSRESSPENVFEQAKRSSPHIFKFDDHQSYLQQHQRKDSASSEVAALLCISGRTSRISSVGSQGSAVSRLSAISGVSRSPSPHRMLLETSFCGPKPVELAGSGGASNASTAASSAHSQADGMPGAGTVAANAALLEQLLLARKHDPTQAVLAEGIKVLPPAPTGSTATTSSRSRSRQTSTLANGERNEKEPKVKQTIGAQRRSTKSPGQMVVGKTASGTEYIRINLRPDHMYSDKGIASNERVVEAPNQLAPVYSKPASLSLQGAPIEEHRLTPTASPKPGRRLTSRSPSPATGAGGGPGGSVSRKSSFSSLFRLGKDSPDSPRETARSRSKSKERPATATGGLGGGGGSQNVTPSKQKSVLAIFKPGKRGSQSSKSSSPIESSVEPVPPPPPPAPGSGSTNRSRTPVGSRPGSRLRYYDEPVEGVIHIPLHTPPEEREARTLLQGIQQLTHAAQASMDPSPLPTHRAPPASAQPVAPGTQITATQLAAAAAALRPVAQRRVAQRPDLDAIQSLPSQEDPPTAPGEEQILQQPEPPNWSLEVQRHSSQDSQETTAESVGSVVSARAANLAQQREQAAMQRLPSVESTQSACEPRLVHTVATVNAPNPDSEAAAKERRRLLFATRLGSGSQEQLFSTQFSISKTESQSSQLSEQVEHSGSETTEGLQRQGTVIRRMETVPPPPPPRGVCSSEEEQGGVMSGSVVMRAKRTKSRPSSEDEAAPTAAAAPADVRHSRYLENFDVRRKLHENLTEAEVGRSGEMPGGQIAIPRKPKRQSVPEPRRETPSYSSGTVTPTTPTPTQATPVGQAKQPPSSATTPTSKGTPVTTTPADAVQASTSVTGPPGTSFNEPINTTRRDQPSTSYKEPPTGTSREPVTTSIREHPSTSHHDSLTSVSYPPPERRHSQSTDEHEPVESSESERDSDMAGSSSVTTAVPAGGEAGRRHHNFPRNVCVIEEHESTGLVSQESFEDELPYIPTTLPEERAQGVSIIPMRERANMELKTCPVDRPRSTTPLNPSHLEEYCTGIMTPQEAIPGGYQETDGVGGVTTGIAGGGVAGTPVRGEKLRISLPRKESIGKERIQNSKSPRRVSNTSGKSWFEFAEEGLRANNNLERKDSAKQLLPVVTPPPAAPSTLEEPKPKASTQRKLSGHWIDFENIPEKRKPAKRITTLPKETLTSSVPATATTSSSSACGSGHRSGSGAGHHHHHHHHHQQATKTNPDGGDKLHYNYVKPEDCQCECHEAERGESSQATAGAGDTSTETGTGTGTGSESLASVELLQQGEDMLPLLEPDTSAEGRIYGDEEQAPLMRHSGKGVNQPRSQHEEFSSPRNRKFPDRK
uniref:Uncharacterized protein, isoform D n=1 Tax=Drosophila melanogaster TaxID=7227 RepID=X2JIM3_DROME|nr:uncharacterized protein Dmel_CG15894, isoform D [Drosophila melanogaster]AHN59412.1 uncharacterized protein Dmel_CG15894, isoform D [Drosophila melanogaster]|eukprot:NP_001284941.1 uncharacterized protein Dmel_CG15894, isoform D [Drosophila melanogaster]